MSAVSRCKLSLGEKRAILEHHSDGMTISAISKAIKRSVSVVHRVIKRYKDFNTISAKPKTGRPRITTPKKDRIIVRASLTDRFKSATSICRDLGESSNINISSRTVSRRLNEGKLKACTPAHKPLISRKNQKARVKYAQEHVVWSKEQWEKVHFSDESKYNLYGSDGKIYVRRRKNERLSVNCVKKTVKYGGGSIMVWGSISAEGTGPLVLLHGKVNSGVYKNVLRQYAIPYMQACNAQPPIFMQDNAPCHKAKCVTEYLKRENIKVMDWPAQSPDLNPIENIWKIVGEKARSRNPKNLEELWTYLKQEWHSIDRDFCGKIIFSCSKRCQDVIKNKGLFTKY